MPTPPLKAFGAQADFQAASHAAVATMGRASRAQAGAAVVEVSAQECIAAALELALVTYTYTGKVASRLGMQQRAHGDHAVQGRADS
jgi:crotonobetainyl-CoA:carnitine CoA-transferase CaiB-like acyl-CoA transferase